MCLQWKASPISCEKVHCTVVMEVAGIRCDDWCFLMRLKTGRKLWGLQNSLNKCFAIRAKSFFMTVITPTVTNIDLYRHTTAISISAKILKRQYSGECYAKKLLFCVNCRSVTGRAEALRLKSQHDMLKTNMTRPPTRHVWSQKCF